MTKIYCHRGYSGLYPENTMLAFEKAVHTGADGMEIDVHLTKDGEVVIFHDERLERVTDGTGFLRDHTLKELKKLDASGKYRGKVPAQRIPTLEEYLSLVAPTGMITNIEFKTELFEYPGLEEKVLDLLARFSVEDRVIFSSFHGNTLLRLEALAPHIPCGLLLQNKVKAPGAGAMIRDLGLQAYHPLYLHLLCPGVLEDAKAHGLQVNTYTPNHKIVFRHLLRKDVDGIITNFPEKAMKLRKRIQGQRDR